METETKEYFIYGKHAALSTLKNPNRTITKVLCIKDFLENKDFNSIWNKFKIAWDYLLENGLTYNSKKIDISNYNES